MSFELFQLLPAVYRIRDAQLAQSQSLLTAAEIADLNSLQALTPPLSADQQAQLAELTAKAARGPLESLLLLVQEQIAAVAYDLEQLYDDQFIETCAKWVIPYIGDLIGYQSVNGIAPTVDNPRSEVAETISLRRRKGTILVMEQLARDVTGWGAHAVEFFRVLADTQYMNHIRLGNHYAPDLRRWQPGIYMNTGFDATAHKVDVRSLSNGLGPYNIPNIGIFLWSLTAYSVSQSAPTPALTVLPPATVGAVYAPVTFTASGGSATTSGGAPEVDTWSLIGSPDLPGGLSLSSGGVLTGTPASGSQGTYTLTATVTDSSGDTTSAQSQLTINPAPAVLTITTPTSPLPTATIGADYPGVTFSASGGTGTYTWSQTGLPASTSLTLAGGGVLSGTPASGSQGLYSFTVTVTDAGTSHTASGQFQIAINPAGLAITSPGWPLPPASVGVAYTATFTAAGGAGGYIWSLTGLPASANLTLNAAGVLSGTPGGGSQGSYTVTVTVADSSGLGASGEFQIAIDPTELSITGPPSLCYRFSQLGMDIPLFSRAVSQGEQISAAAQPVNVPERLLRRVLCADLQNGVGGSYYGPGNSLSIWLNGQLLNPYQIRVADLSGPEGAWHNLPTSSLYAAVVDPELGRIALPPPRPGSAPPQLEVSYYYGFNAGIGGGEYERSAGFTVTDPAWIFPFPDTASSPRYCTLEGAVKYAVKQFDVHDQVAVEVASSGVFTLSGGLAVDLPAGTTLELRAADLSRPTLLLDGEIAITGDASSTFILNGFVVAASSTMAPATPTPAALVHLSQYRPSGANNLLGQLSLTDCTLVPGWSVRPHGEPVEPTAPTLIVEPPVASVVVKRSILGAIWAAPLSTISLCDSIVDATDPANVAYAAPPNPIGGSGGDGGGGGALTLTGCTVVGTVHATLLTLVSDSIIWAAFSPGSPGTPGLVADRKQEGCVRFSFIPYNAVTPRTYECVEQALASPQPYFLSLRYGHPAYMKLLACTDDSIRRGASDGGEMGAFHFLLAPQRESDLQIRLQEYLPVGLNFGLIYQN